jgi:alkanesulfonate monooxygenase SsuD/methylene tetrahydromethanopterin reductase-like flavin-dependent oxidoreductase (luciferase family)
MTRFGLYYDFRNPPTSGRSFEQVYRENLDQIRWAETAGFDSFWVSEHYFSDDGYTPSPLSLATTIASHTKQARVGTNLVLLPLHDPLRLAGDAATAAIVAEGRFDLGVGLGYREFEYKTFGRNLINRVSLMEESIAILRNAFAGEPINHHGKRFSVNDVTVSPVATQGPRILIGGNSEPAIDRAARLGDGYLSAFNGFHSMYLDAAKRHSAVPSIFASQWVIVAEDPERAWVEAGPLAAYMLNVYAQWGAYGPPSSAPVFDADSALSSGLFSAWDVDTAVTNLTSLIRDTPQIEDVHFWARLPGESIDSSNARNALIAERVIPAVQADRAMRATHT